MKIRNDFITNSSSSSFVITKNALSEEQIKKILNYEKYAKEVLPDEDPDDSPWGIYDSEYYIEGRTYMDNFNMGKYLLAIGVPSAAIRFDY